MEDSELYPDDAPEEKEEDAPKDKSDSKEKDDKKDESPTELIGKKLLHIDEDEELKPGHKCEFEVVRDWGDSVEIRYIKKSKDREESSADDELDAIESGYSK